VGSGNGAVVTNIHSKLIEWQELKFLLFKISDLFRIPDQMESKFANKDKAVTDTNSNISILNLPGVLRQ
jgi:hypothetical protein